MSEKEAAELTSKTIKTVSRRIVEIRRERGHTQPKLAEIVNVCVRTISNWENGKISRNAIPHLCSLAVALNCSVLDFFQDTKLPKFRPGRPRNNKKNNLYWFREPSYSEYSSVCHLWPQAGSLHSQVFVNVCSTKLTCSWRLTSNPWLRANRLFE